MKFRCIVFFLFCSFQIGYSQSEFTPEIKKAYHNYFELPRETIYLHLNKTKYIKGEKIWFSAYIYNRRTGLPFLETTNLICGIYDATGQQLAKELFQVENGVASGHFGVKTSFESGNFYIKASTNYLKNFKEETDFVEKIEIIGPASTKLKELNSSAEYDIQLLPEGGHIVSGVKNTIGFKITNPQAKGISISNGSLINSKNNVVLSNLGSNIYGIGKFVFKHEANETYFLQFKFSDGSKISKKIPEAKELGIALTINNLFDNKLAIELRTNRETLRDIKEQDMYLAVHRDGMLTLNPFKLNTTEKSISIGKDKLWPGINIITLFNTDLKPVSERLFFNQTNLNLGRVSVNTEKEKNSKDSTQIKLNLFSKNNSPSNVSISILPEDTMANENSQSIISSFLLRPYIKSEVENASYYFRNMNRKKRFELDMLLLTQGWSRYEWNDIFENPPQEKYKFDQGIQITGKVINAEYNQQNQLAFYGKKTKNIQFAEIDNLREFRLNTNRVIKDDSVSIGLMNKKGEIKKPKLADIVFSPSLQRDTLTPQITRKDVAIIENSEIHEKKVNLDIFYEDNTIDLENVTVSDNKIDKQLKRNPSLKVGVYEGIKVSPNDVKLKPTLTHLLTRLGFRTNINPATGDGVILPKTRRPLVIPPKVVIDDFVVVDFTRGINNLPNSILTSSTDLIDEVYYEHAGLEGSSGGTIYIYRKYGTSVTEEHKEVFTKMLLTEGFQRPTEYYNPKYSSHNSNDFLNYGVIHWENNLSIDTTGKAALNFPHFGLKNVQLFIEGISQNGTLFSEIKTISLN